MAIDDTDKIDILFRDKKGHAVLVIADHLDWEEFDEGEHLLLLQEKLPSLHRKRTVEAEQA